MSEFSLKDYINDVEKTAEVSAEDQEKIAAAQEEGREMAVAFIDELEKTAVGDAPITEDTASIKSREDLNHMSTQPIKMDQINKVDQIIKSLTSGTQGGVQEIAQSGNVVDQGGPHAPNEQALPADAMNQQEQQAAIQQEVMQKSAADHIIDTLWNNVIGEDLTKTASEQPAEVGEALDYLTKTAAYADALLDEEYKGDYDEEDVIKLAETLVYLANEEADESEKTAELEAYGRTIAQAIVAELKDSAQPEE